MKLFISYAREDENQVKELARILRAGGHEPWLDQEKITGGQSWLDEINNAVTDTDAFILILTPKSLESQYTQYEFKHAARLGKPIIPVLLDRNTKLPDDVRRYQYADFTSGITSEKVAQLIGGLGHIARRIAPEKELELEAIELGETAKREEQQPQPPLSKPSLVTDPTIPDELTPSSIFISYKRMDWNRFVLPLVEFLREQKFSIWVDQHLLEGGQDWMDEINKALKLCRCMILCVTPEALDSKYVKYEYRYFFHTSKPLIPLICRETDLHPELWGFHFVPYKEIETLPGLLNKYLGKR